MRATTGAHTSATSNGRIEEGQPPLLRRNNSVTAFCASNSDANDSTSPAVANATAAVHATDSMPCFDCSPQALHSHVHRSCHGCCVARCPRSRNVYRFLAVGAIFAVGCGIGFALGKRYKSTSCICNSIIDSARKASSVPAHPSAAPSRSNAPPFDDGILDAEGDKEGTIPPIESSFTASSDNAFASCVDLRSDVRAAARRVGKDVIEQASLLLRQGNTSVFDSFQWTSTSRNVGPMVASGLGKSTGRGPRATTAAANMQTESSTRPWSAVQTADMVQSNEDSIFVVYAGDLVVINAVTTTISSRWAIPKRTRSSIIRGLLLVNASLAVMIQEMETVYLDARSLSTTGSNTTILLYDTSTLTLQRRQSIAGLYVDAYAVGTNVYLSTRVELSIHKVSELLTPAYIQSLFPATVLNETSYRILAQQQLDLHLESFARRLTDKLDCTDMVRLPILGPTNTSATLLIAVLSSFDMATSPIVQNRTQLLLPDLHWTVFATERRLILVCQDYGAASIFTATQSQTTSKTESKGAATTVTTAADQVWLITLNVTGMSTVVTSPAVIAGVIRGDLAPLHVWSTSDGDDYTRLATTSSNGTVEVHVLKMTPDRDRLMPVTGRLSALGRARPETMQSILFDDHRIFIAASANADANTLYSIDTSDPRMPTLLGELAIPDCPSHLHSVNSHLLVGIGGGSSTLDESFHVTLLDISQVSEMPHLVQHAYFGSARDQQPNTTSDIVVTTSIDFDRRGLYFFDDAMDNNLVVLVPVYDSRFQVQLCEASDDDYWRNDSWKLRSRSNASKETTSASTVYPSTENETCYTNEETVFDGFRIFTIDASHSSITELLAVDHYPKEWVYHDCSAMGRSAVLSPRAIVINGDVTTIKGNTILCHDLLTRSEAAPELNLDAAC